MGTPVRWLLAFAILGTVTGTVAAQDPPLLQSAVFTGGSFHHLERDLQSVYGVVSVVTGYTGGSARRPTHSSYARGGHSEAVWVNYDPSRVSYAELLDAYWRHGDPTDSGGQFRERGSRHRPAVWVLDEAQRRAAEASRAALDGTGRLPRPVAIPILPAVDFTPAEDRWQDLFTRDPARYARIRARSGRDRALVRLWGPEAEADPGAPPGPVPYRKPPRSSLSRTLTPIQLEVTQRGGTEPAFHNEYWENEKPGIYVDVVSGEPLFCSRDKYDSGTGWPSFTQALEPGNIVLRVGTTLGIVQSEVRSRHADSHLGHVFDDGPAPTRLRYCMNSAALRFVPVEALAREGYGKYLRQFGS